MRKATRPHAIRKTSGPETRVSLGVALLIGILYYSVVIDIELCGQIIYSLMLLVL